MYDTWIGVDLIQRQHNQHSSSILCPFTSTNLDRSLTFGLNQAIPPVSYLVHTPPDLIIDQNYLEYSNRRRAAQPVEQFIAQEQSVYEHLHPSERDLPLDSYGGRAVYGTHDQIAIQGP
jgi:hypothetical protein